MKEDVLPFVGSTVLLVAGWGLAFWLDRSTKRVAGSAGTKFTMTVPSELARYVSLWMDRAQAVSLLGPPAVGLLLDTTRVVRWINAVALVVAVVCLANVFRPRDPLSYGARQGWSKMSLVLGASALVNGAGLAVALLTE